MVDIAIADAAAAALLLPLGPGEVVDVLDTLQVHGQPLQAVGDLTGDGAAVDATDLLKVGELRDLHAIEPDLPAQAPGPQRGVLPVVLDKANVMGVGVDAECTQRVKVELEDVCRRGLEHHLKLVVMLQAVGIFAVAAILGPTRWLHIGRTPGLGAQRP